MRILQGETVVNPLRVPCHGVGNFIRDDVETSIELLVSDHQRSQKAKDVAIDSGAKDEQPA